MRYPDNFTQTLPLDVYETLHAWARYVGTDPDLAHLQGVMIPTREVERAVYVGERECVEVANAAGNLVLPWKHVAITELDETGSPVVRNQVHEMPEVTTPPEARMSRAQLGELGFTDYELGQLAKETLGIEYDHLAPGASRRREVFDLVMASAYEVSTRVQSTS